jgi:hypothetical protein
MDLERPDPISGRPIRLLGRHPSEELLDSEENLLSEEIRMRAPRYLRWLLGLCEAEGSSTGLTEGRWCWRGKPAREEVLRRSWAIGRIFKTLKAMKGYGSEADANSSFIETVIRDGRDTRI